MTYYWLVDYILIVLFFGILYGVFAKNLCFRFAERLTVGFAIDEIKFRDTNVTISFSR